MRASRPTGAGTRPQVVIGPSCTACGGCVATCPTGALRRAPRRPDLVAELCTGCLECLEICPAGAISEGVVGRR